MDKVNGHKINGVTSKQMDEIQSRLRAQETAKAIRLLAQASSYYDAFKFTKERITKEVLKNGHDTDK